MIVHDAFRNFIRTPSGLILSEDAARLRYAPPPVPTGGDFFSGCGGAALGFKQAGIHMLFGVEWDIDAAVTYLINLGADQLGLHIETEALRAKLEKAITRTNKTTGLQEVTCVSGCNRRSDILGTEHFWIWDVRNLTGQMILDKIGLKPGELDVLHGSPPCQGYSIAGKRNIADPRNNLMFEYARLITEIQPKSFTLEQVPGVLTMTTEDGQPVIDAFLDALETGGYAKRQVLEKAIKALGGGAMLLRKSRKEPERALDEETARQDDLQQMDMFA